MSGSSDARAEDESQENEEQDRSSDRTRQKEGQCLFRIRTLFIAEVTTFTFFLQNGQKVVAEQLSLSFKILGGVLRNHPRS